MAENPDPESALDSSSDAASLEGASVAPAEYLVGIGASAGGLEALQALISNLPSGLGSVAFVVAQHLSPTYKSQLVELIARQTDLPVKDALNNEVPRARTIYITPPDSEISLRDGRFVLVKPRSQHGKTPAQRRCLLFFSCYRVEGAGVGCNPVRHRHRRRGRPAGGSRSRRNYDCSGALHCPVRWHAGFCPGSRRGGFRTDGRSDRRTDAGYPGGRH
ncbi:MAG: hypothetical protein KDK25_08205 [Leptospiraceae bacterium]|nr:hypothetical protein [Leptospiraceae bacterium]